MQPQADTDADSALPGGFPNPSPNEPSQDDSSKIDIAKELYERRDEYLVKKQIKIKIGTWNVASVNGAEKDLKNWFVQEQDIADHLASLRLADEANKSKSHSEAAGVGTTDESQTRAQASEKSGLESAADTQEVGLYVLGLQEIVDITSAAQLLSPYIDPAPAKRWRVAIEEALPLGYQPVAEQQLVGLHIIIYASPRLKPLISDVATINVPTGGMGWTGNKGCVGVRLVLGRSSRIVFVNSHLTAGTEKANLERRNWDVNQILSRSKFPAVENEYAPTDGQVEVIGDEDFAFWFGDLNYRLDGIPGDDVRRLLNLHTTGLYGKAQKLSADTEDLAYGEDTSGSEETSNASLRAPSSFTLVDEEETNSAAPDTRKPLVQQKHSEINSDPTSLQHTINTLLAHDQLKLQIKEGKVFFDGWEEGQITFLPTYKYDIGTVDIFDTSEKMRPPSYCDRVMFLHRPKWRRLQAALLKLKVGEESNNPHTGVIFEYDPDEDGDEASANLPTQHPKQNKPSRDDMSEVGIQLEDYNAFQYITKSDHKPLSAVFLVTFTAEDQKRKDATFWNVARMMDTTENDNRPRVTIVSHPFPFVTERTVNFGFIKFDELCQNEITIANTGMKPASVSIVKVKKENAKWLTVSAWEGKKVMQVGDVLNMKVVAHVTDKGYAHKLNKSNTEGHFEHIFIVRVDGGADLFVCVRAEWVLWEEPKSGYDDDSF